MDMGPKTQNEHQGYAQVNENEHGEKSVVERIRRQKVARGWFAEDRQPVEQLGAGDGGELGQPIPDDPVAADAGNVAQPQDGNTGDPGIEAETVIASVSPFAHQVQSHDQDKGVRRVTVQAAQYASEVPLLASQMADRVVNAVNAGVEHRVEIETRSHNDPEKIQAHGAKVA